jgi:hypothetical protein
MPGAALGVERPAVRLPNFAQFAADELGDEFLEELVHVEQEREDLGAAGRGAGKVRRMNPPSPRLRRAGAEG